MRSGVITSPWKKSPERKQERELKREAVLAAAAHVFAENGYHRASLDEVARILNVTKPTLYYYFKNKEAMLFACIEHGLEMFRSEATSNSSSKTTNGLQRLTAYLKRYASVIESDFGRCTVRISDSELSEPSSRKIRRIKSEIDRELRQLVADGQADGSIAPADPHITALALAGALNSIGLWRHQDAALPVEQTVDDYIGLLVNGLAPRKPAAKK